MSSHLGTSVDLLDDSEIDLPTLSGRLGEPASIDFERLISLSRKLPSGFIHADALWLLSEPPKGIDPLAPGSSWYAVGRELLVVVRSGDKWNASELVECVIQYYRAAVHVHTRLSTDERVVEMLLSGEVLDAETQAKIALALDAPIDFFHRVETDNSELRFDLGWMGRRLFAPVIRVHASLRPSVGRVRGDECVQRILQSVPDGPIRLIVSDHECVFEHVSPYIRDLTQALCQWGIENSTSLSTSGLATALVERMNQPSTELAALLVPDLLEDRSDIRQERRDAESQAGLHYVWDDSLKAAWADLASLEGADHFVMGSDPRGLLVVVSSPSEETLVSITRGLLETRRVLICGGVFALEGRTPGVVYADCLVGPEDGVNLNGRSEFMAQAELADTSVESVSILEMGSGPRFSETAMRIAKLVRRENLKSGINRDPRVTKTIVSFYRENQGSLQIDMNQSLSRLSAHRLVLATMVQAEDPPVSDPGKRRNSPNSNNFRV